MTAGLHPWNAYAADAGFAPKSDDRIAGASAHGERVRQRLIREGQRGPREKEMEPSLPKEFIAKALAMLEVHLCRGHFEQAKATIDEIEAMWDVEREPVGVELPINAHVTALRLDQRTVNMIDAVCSGTVGALLDVFPRAFVRLNNCGAGTVEKIAKALKRAGVLDAAAAERRIDEYQLLMSRNPGFSG